jgi:large subunit ribosomal protein L21
MYAVIKAGGKQYKVNEGDVIKIEKVAGEVGDKVEFGEVLLIADAEQLKIGQPLVPDARVIGNIVDQGKGKKIIIFKAKRRKGYRKKQGHRQTFTGLKIDKIIG